MCYALYFRADIPCQTTKWEPHDRNYYFEDLQEKDQIVVHNFSKPYVYYAGSWRGCGCGFFAEPKWANSHDHIEEIESTKNCISDFVTCLNKFLQKSNEIELFLCWEGDQSKEPERKGDTNEHKKESEHYPHPGRPLSGKRSGEFRKSKGTDQNQGNDGALSVWWIGEQTVL